MGLSSTKALQAKPEARDSTALWPGGSITQFIPAQVSQCQAWVADRPPTLGGSQRSGVLREARALGCRGMDEAREWCWAGNPGPAPFCPAPAEPGVLFPKCPSLSTFQPASFSVSPSIYFLYLSGSPVFLYPWLVSSLSLSEHLSLSLSDSFPLPLILPFPLRITSSEAETIHLRGITCSWPSRHSLGLARPQALYSEWLFLPALPACQTHLTTEPYGHRSPRIQQGLGFTSLGLGDRLLPTQKALSLGRPCS